MASAGSVSAVVGEHGGTVFGGEFSEFRLEFPADGNDDALFGFGALAHFFNQRPLAEGVGFIDVGDIEHFFGSHEAQRFEQSEFLRLKAHGAHRDAALQLADDAFHQRSGGEGFLIAGTGEFSLLVDVLFRGFQVREDQFSVDGVNKRAAGSTLPSTWVMSPPSKQAARRAGPHQLPGCG